MAATARATKSLPPPYDPGAEADVDRSEALRIGARIAARAKERRISLAQLSREVGKAEGYMSMFVTKGAPEKLPMEVRMTLSRILEIPEDLLRTSRQQAPAMPLYTLDEGQRADGVPVFREGQEIDPDRATERIPRPPFYNGPLGSMFAVWITREHPRLRVGDLIYVSPQPAKPGDLAALMHSNSILAIGELIRSNNSSYVMVTGDRAHIVDQADRVLKIGHIVLG